MASDERLLKKDDIARLPKLARVAFAARCARRVQLLHKAGPLNGDEMSVGSADRAIAISERCGETADAADYAEIIDTENVGGIYVVAATGAAANAANAAAHAAYAAFYANDPGAGNAVAAGDDAYAAAYHAAAHAAFSAHRSSDAGFDAITYAATGAIAQILRDFELLEAAAEREHWDDDTTVSPAFFGPMWPNGAPDGWPADETRKEDEVSELVVELEVPEGVTDEQLYKIAVRLAKRADKLHRAYGCRGLELRSIDVEEDAHVREGAPA